MIDPLENLVIKTSKLAKVHRGRDILPYCVDILQSDFDIDGGVFVYQRRFIEPGPPEVYHPFGMLADAKIPLQTELNRGKWFYRFSEDRIGKWLPITELPQPLTALGVQLSAQQVGVWPITSSGRRVGAMVLTKASHSNEKDNSQALSITAIQFSLILDLIIAKRVAEQSSHQDALTGLWNRRGLLERLPEFTRKSMPGQQLVVGLIDINDFKVINDTKGHSFGDNVLHLVGQRLLQAIGTKSLCSRWGGDEFAFVLWTNVHARDTEARLNTLFHDLPFSLSTGCSIWNLATDDWETCLFRADQRMYWHKCRA